MNKNAILTILNDWNFWGKWPDVGIKRPFYSEILKKLLKTGQIVAITGPRRAGKSFIMKQFAKDLTENGISPGNILIVNLEDPRFENPAQGLSG